jgi:hypothetical protein
VAHPATCARTTIDVLTPQNTRALYVAAYRNADPSNVTQDWLPIFSCTSELGSSNTDGCTTGALVLRAGDQCYERLDIQIMFTKIGSLSEPQSILSAVIFHYQAVSPCGCQFCRLTTSVTFEEIANPSVIEEASIPPASTRLPANFFYPFSISDASNLGIPCTLVSLFSLFVLCQTFL